MAIFNTVYGGESKWIPGSNTLVYYDFENDSGTTVTNKGTWGSTMNGTATGVTFETLTSGKKVAYNSSSTYTNGIVTSNTKSHSGTITMFIRCKSSTSNSNRALLCGFSTGNHELHLALNADGGKTDIANYENSWRFYGKSSTSSTDGNWHLLVYTYNSSDGNKVYQDTNLLTMSYSNGNANTEPIVTSAPVYVMKMSSGTSNWSFVGYVGCFGIEDKARTSDEIAKYYNQTKANYGL